MNRDNLDSQVVTMLLWAAIGVAAACAIALVAGFHSAAVDLGLVGAAMGGCAMLGCYLEGIDASLAEDE